MNSEHLQSEAGHNARIVNSQIAGQPAEYEQNLLDLKLKINSLCWENLPAKTTLDEAENVACEIFFLITDKAVAADEEVDES